MPSMTQLSPQVCDKPVTKETNKKSSTVAAQQYIMLRTAGNSGVHPRAQFRKDLMTFLKLCTSQNKSILFIGDFNETLGSDKSGMAGICNTINLVDISLQHHRQSDFATYIQGSSRLDYALRPP
jgi:hypothetical protein